MTPIVGIVHSDTLLMAHNRPPVESRDIRYTKTSFVVTNSFSMEVREGSVLRVDRYTKNDNEMSSANVGLRTCLYS